MSENFSRLRNYFQDDSIVRRNKDEDKAAEYRNKIFFPSKKEFLQQGTDFIDRSGRKYQIGYGTSIVEILGHEKIFTRKDLDSGEHAKGNQILFFLVDKDIRESKGLPELGELELFNIEKDIYARGIVSQVLSPRERFATGYLVLDFIDLHY